MSTIGEKEWGVKEKHHSPNALFIYTQSPESLHAYRRPFRAVRGTDLYTARLLLIYKAAGEVVSAARTRRLSARLSPPDCSETPVNSPRFLRCSFVSFDGCARCRLAQAANCSEALIEDVFRGAVAGGAQHL